MSHYGLSSTDFDLVHEKFVNQSGFLKRSFVARFGVIKQYKDVSYSANHSELYFAQLLNKVHTLDRHNFDIGNIPLFLTITGDGFLRDLLRGDYSRFSDEVYSRYIKHIPNDARHGFILDKISNRSPLSVRDMYKILLFQVRRFFRSNVFQKMKKFGHSYTFLRVTEPHKDGFPHFHILLYVHESYLPRVHFNFVKYFPASQNHKPLSLRRNGRFSTVHNVFGIKESMGFQFAIGSSTGYILKYILKTFRDVQSDLPFDFLNGWYLHHRIPRIITSHSIIPAWVYRRLSLIDPDWFYLNKVDYGASAEWASEVSVNGVVTRREYIYFDDHEGRVFELLDGVLRSYNQGVLINEIFLHDYKDKEPSKTCLDDEYMTRIVDDDELQLLDRIVHHDKVRYFKNNSAGWDIDFLQQVDNLISIFA